MAACALIAAACSAPALPWLQADESRAAVPATIVWTLDDLAKIAGHAPEVLGAPALVAGPGGKATAFDGIDDGLVVPAVQIAGWTTFTIEVLLRVDPTGGAEQRFLHLQGADNQRALIELRLTEERTWCLDTFLFSGEKRRLTLIDRARLHPADVWQWVALTYDGRTMAHYVGGTKECEGEVEFGPMEAGRTSLGVRMNKVSWFKGAIREVRFHPVALAPEKLQRVAAVAP